MTAPLNGSADATAQDLEAQRAADESLDHETPLSEVFEDQIACADIGVFGHLQVILRSRRFRPIFAVHSKSV